jgi:hypothetical protein
MTDFSINFTLLIVLLFNKTLCMIKINKLNDKTSFHTSILDTEFKDNY